MTLRVAGAPRLVDSARPLRPKRLRRYQADHMNGESDQ